MDGESREVGETSRDKSSKMGRRRFLRLGGLVGASTLVGVSTFGAAANFIDTKAADQSSSAPTETPTVVLNPTTTASSPTQLSAETPSVRKETVEDHIKNNPLFQNFSDTEKDAGLRIVKERIDFYSNIFRRFDTSERTTKTLGLKEQVDKSYELVKGKLDNLELNKNGLSDEQIKELLLNIIFVESGGVSTAVNLASGATGLCQLLPDTAEQAAKLVGIPFSKEKLKNADFNIQLAAVHLGRLLNTFHDPSMALWAYHFGDGNMKKVIKVYLESVLTPQEYKEVTDEYEEVRRVSKFNKVDLSTQKDNRKSSARLIDYYKLNFVKLITSGAVKRWLENKRKESEESERVVSETLKYVPSLGAAGHLLRENKKVA